MRKRHLLILSGFLLFLTATAQEAEWKSYVEQARLAEEQARHLEAAHLYRQAWNLKSGKKNLLLKAGNAFFNARAYEEAAQAFAPIRKKEGKFPLVGLKYARSLKQLGRYHEAMVALEEFAQSYKGPRQDLAQRIVDIDKEGCEMGLERSKQAEFANLRIEFSGQEINSDFDDQSPVPFADTSFLWVSRREESGRLYEQRKWSEKGQTEALPAEALPETENRFIGSACSSEDGKRIYFTKCSSYLDPLGLAREECSIYVMYSIGKQWTLPIRLNEKINAPESSSSHPFVVTVDEEEWLFFSSDRRGSLGGMDIWCSKRPLEDEEFSFSYPENCSRPLNTRGDEITPFYRPSDSTLFFSSNAHPGFGGYDIFFSTLKPNNRWEEPQNPGYPLNSPANDLFFLEKNPSEGFLVSNRNQNEKLPPKQDYDIFSFSSECRKVQISGKILEKASNRPLPRARITLYARGDKSDRTQKLLSTQPEENGTFSFELEAVGDYRISVFLPGYETEHFEFSSEKLQTPALEYSFFLQKSEE
jgi:tetratricopeptide (TPR) repeat protein